MDVKNAFLKGDLNEEVHMAPPLDVTHQAGEVCKHRKTLYGRKQAPRTWFENFSQLLLLLDLSLSIMILHYLLNAHVLYIFCCPCMLMQ